jgi:dipeptidase D
MQKVWHEMYGRDCRVEVIHAGLECGILADKIKELDCVSFGPDILDIHTTRERLSISSVQRTWKYLLEVLKAL